MVLAIESQVEHDQKHEIVFKASCVLLTSVNTCS